MVWDIVIGLIGACAQFLTAWLGWLVTIKPPHDARKKNLYRLLFVGAGILGVIAVCAATTRNSLTTEHLERALGLNRANLSSSKDQSDGIEFEFVSAQRGETLRAKVKKKNTGLLDALHVKGYSFATVYDGSRDIEDICNELEQNLHDLVIARGSTETTIPSNETYVMDVRGPVVSHEQAAQIDHGGLGVYVAGAFYYTDQEHPQTIYQWRYRKLVKGNTGDCANRPWGLNWPPSFGSNR